MIKEAKRHLDYLFKDMPEPWHMKYIIDDDNIIRMELKNKTFELRYSMPLERCEDYKSLNQSWLNKIINFREENSEKTQ